MKNKQLIDSGLTIVSILLWTMILKYIMNLDTCECADYRGRKFIEYYIMFNIAISVLRIANFNIKVPPTIMTMYFIFTTIFVLVVYHYIQYLKSSNCACSVNFMRDVLEVVNYIQLGLLTFVVILAVYIVISIGTLAMDKYENMT